LYFCLSSFLWVNILFFHNTTFNKNSLSVLEHKDKIYAHNAIVICQEALRTEGHIVVTVVTHMLPVPAVRGDVMWYATLAAPAECPIKVMLRGSPPNSSIFSRTHSSAKYWSSKPRFPLATEFSRQKNPRNRRILETEVTSQR
jgi:hypothetical protein